MISDYTRQPFRYLHQILKYCHESIFTNTGRLYNLFHNFFFSLILLILKAIFISTTTKALTILRAGVVQDMGWSWLFTIHVSCSSKQFNWIKLVDNRKNNWENFKNKNMFGKVSHPGMQTPVFNSHHLEAFQRFETVRYVFIKNMW